MKALKFRNQLILGYSTLLLMFMIMGYVIFTNVNHLINISGWVEHTYKAIANGNQLVAEMINMETGMRGFMVSGNDEHLEPYIFGEKNFNKVMAETQNMVSDNPPQVERLGKALLHWKFHNCYEVC